MPTVRKDAIGLYISSDGYIARPVGSTIFAEGDTPKSNHFNGCPLHGVGKDATCGRGEYTETWLGCGEVALDKTYEQRKAKYDWYMDYARTTYPLMGN